MITRRLTRQALLIMTGAVFLLFLCPSFSGAQWHLKEERNVFSGIAKQTALSQNNREEVLTIYKNQVTNEIWANFALPESDTEYLSPKNPPTIIIDDNQPFSPLFEWYPKWFNLLLQSPERPQDHKILTHLLKGDTITITYHNAVGEQLTSRFTLRDSSHIIKTAIGQ